MQKPPIYSAIKVNGQRAYKMARQGQKVDLEARPVNIYSLRIISYNYPMLSLSTKVSSGTYIRSLVTDLGEKLSTGAYMADLKRTKVGKFKLENSVNVEKLSFKQIAEHIIT
jgi:tRNA pseudouridine55 synthase